MKKKEAQGKLGPLAGAAEGRLRWAVNSTDWKPAGEQEGREFQFLVSLIRENAERDSVSKFVRFVDQKRAVLSRLLVRRACAAVLGHNNYRAIEIARTKGKKPFLRAPRPAEDRPDLGNFNFNISHEGDWVVLASEPLCLCGVDVAAPHDRRPGGKEFDVFETFKEQLTEEEWRVVEREAATAVAKRMAMDEEEGLEDESAAANRPRPLNQPVGYQAFQRFWSAKEAFVKARGDGLGFELNRAEFKFSLLDEDLQSYLATISIDGQPAPMWRCFQQRLGERHWATVARGPTSDVVDQYGEFTRTLTRPTSEFSAHAWEQELLRESPSFEQVPVGFLVPPDDMEDYVTAGGTPWYVGMSDEASEQADPEPPKGTGGAEAAPPADGTSEAAAKAQAAADAKPKEDRVANLMAKDGTPASPTELVERGNIHFRAEEYQQARQCYTGAIESAEAEATGTQAGKQFVSLLYSNRAESLLELADLDGALLDANKAVQLDRGNGKAFYNKGRAYEGLKRYEEALECLQTAWRLCSDDPAVQKLLFEVAKKVQPK